MDGLNARDRCASIINHCFRASGYQPGIHTSSFSETGDIFAVHDLGMLYARPNRGDVRVLERHFEGVEDGSVRSITNGVDALEAHRAGVSVGEGKRSVGVHTTCHPSSRYLGIISFRVSGSILMKP